MGYTRLSYISPSRALVISMIITLIIGIVLLSLPIAQNVFVSPVDVFFTATSSLCVTGLMTVPYECFNHFGHLVIMFLMQIGGLGVVTLSLFVASLFFNLGLSTQGLAGEILELDSWYFTRRILIFIIIVTVVTESIGACAIYCCVKDFYASSYEAWFFSIFHSISSFCNAGITLTKNSMEPYNSYNSLLIITAILMLIGGIGFITLRDLLYKIYPSSIVCKRSISLQTRIVLYMTCALFIINVILFWFFERYNTFENMSSGSSINNAIFMAISTRSGGFSSVYANNLQMPTLMLLIINSFIGWAPGGTGSGIKFTTITIFVAMLYSVIKGRFTVLLHNRTIPSDQLFKAFAVVVLSFLWIFLIIFILLCTEKSWSFLNVVFETFSAFSNLGISTGKTETLSFIGKIIISLTMFFGRIGVVTVIMSLIKKQESYDFSYPEERVMLS